MARVIVCGLGPATPELLTVTARAAIERVPHRYLRTRQHPAARAVDPAVSFDDLYDTAATFGEVYAGIVERLVEAASDHGEVLYAVPGSPMIAEATVQRLRADWRVEVEILPAVSFLDLAWARLGIDPVDAGVRLVDGHRFEMEAAGDRGPLLVVQCDQREVLSSVKLAISEALGDGEGNGGDGRVTVLQRLGLPDEVVREVCWEDLDREVTVDQFTSVYVPRLAAPITRGLVAFGETVRRLRAECPWDREQTHASLRRHLLEEAYEVLEAIDHLDVAAGQGFDALEEELGDLLFQVFFHARLAAEEGHFDLADVARTVREKLVGRHPHVFGDAVAETADDVRARWEQIKKEEKGRASILDGIPSALPALLYALKVQKRLASEGIDWRDLLTGDQPQEAERPSGPRIGGQLLDLVDEARRANLDPETELRLAAEQVRDRFTQRQS
jgi:tetrapyrrole methylase family protein / MazG family protein